MCLTPATSGWAVSVEPNLYRRSPLPLVFSMAAMSDPQSPRACGVGPSHAAARIRYSVVLETLPAASLLRT